MAEMAKATGIKEDKGFGQLCPGRHHIGLQFSPLGEDLVEDFDL